MKSSSRYQVLYSAVLIFLLSSIGLAIFRKLNSSLDLFNNISIASVICGLVFFFALKISKKINYENILVLIIVSLTFFTSHQMTLLNIDRSRSYFVIGWIHEGNVTIKGERYDYDNVNSPEKVNAQASDLRISEQISRGYVIRRNGILELSTSGKTLHKVAELLSEIYSLDNWKLNKY